MIYALNLIIKYGVRVKFLMWWW